MSHWATVFPEGKCHITSKFSESRYRVPRCCAMLRLCQLGAVAARRQRGAWQSSAWGFVTGDGGKKAAAYVDVIYASSRFGVKLSRNGLTNQEKNWFGENISIERPHLEFHVGCPPNIYVWYTDDYTGILFKESIWRDHVWGTQDDQLK